MNRTFWNRILECVPALQVGFDEEIKVYEQEVWRGSDLSCFIMAPHILETRINVPEKELLPGHPYQFVAIVLNPQVTGRRDFWEFGDASPRLVP